jgi:hypothetical protein
MLVRRLGEGRGRRLEGGRRRRAEGGAGGAEGRGLGLGLGHRRRRAPVRPPAPSLWSQARGLQLRRHLGSA